jgi:hypothetical protein
MFQLYGYNNNEEDKMGVINSDDVRFLKEFGDSFSYIAFTVHFSHCSVLPTKCTHKKLLFYSFISIDIYPYTCFSPWTVTDCQPIPLHTTTRKATRLQLTTKTIPRFRAQVTNTANLNILNYDFNL